MEFALVQKDVLFGLRQGTQVLQAINKEMGGIEGVDRLMGETEEARAYQEVWVLFISAEQVKKLMTVTVGGEPDAGGPFIESG